MKKKVAVKRKKNTVPLKKDGSIDWDAVLVDLPMSKAKKGFVWLGSFEKKIGWSWVKRKARKKGDHFKSQVRRFWEKGVDERIVVKWLQACFCYSCIVREIEDMYAEFNKSEGSPAMAAKKVAKAKKAAQGAKNGIGKAKHLVFEKYPMTATIRAMGKAGLTIGQVRKACSALKIPAKEGTMSTNVALGRKGKLTTAPLTQDELGKIKKAGGPAEKPKAKPKAKAPAKKKVAAKKN